MTGFIGVPRSGERASATPSGIVHAAVAVTHSTADTNVFVALARSVARRDGEFATIRGQSEVRLIRQVDRILILLAATSLGAIASYALITATAG